MPTELSLDDHLGGLAAAVARGAAAARSAALHAHVPTCPPWDVRELVARVGMVHRWDAANLRGRGDDVGSGATLKGEGRDSPDPVAWWDDDADELDGLDELLGGFLTRGKKLAVETPRTLAVIVGDEHSWLLTLSDQAPVTVRTPPGRAVPADHVITGTAVGPYLAPWSRGDELATDRATMDWWRTVARIHSS